MSEEALDLDYGPADDDLDDRDPDALRGTRGVLVPLHALRLGQALWKVRRADGIPTDTIAAEIASAYGLEVGQVAVLLPVVCRPAWSHHGTRAAWPVDPRADERHDVKAPKPAAVTGEVYEIDPLAPLAKRPEVVVKLREVAEKAGWSCIERWGAANEAVRSLVPNADGEGKHFEVALVRTMSVSLRLERAGHRTYGLWSAPMGLEPTWTYRGGGIDGEHGVKVTALRKAIRDTDS